LSPFLKFDFWWGTAPDPAGGAYSTLAGSSRGATSKGREENGRGRKGFEVRGQKRTAVLRICPAKYTEPRREKIT